MNSETNIIEIIKSRRFFGKALKTLLTRQQRLKMKEKSRYLYIDPNSKEPMIAKETDAPKYDSDDNEVVEYTDGFYSSDSSLDQAHIEQDTHSLESNSP